uniref:15-hydroxyprostaglandin dehydrogenase n=1 Tax=Gasterosteus aculeatus aculeatus TaxID=481459 RepID=G3PVZ8_GASAC
MSLNGKVALVTGGAQGIGRAVVERLLQSSAKVAVVDLNKACGEESKTELDAMFGEGNCYFIPCDVSNGDALRDAFHRTVDQFGRLDIVINNAGINNEKNWEKTIQVNLTSVIKGTYLALEQMSKEYKKEGGAIINVSSMAAFVHSPHQPVYTATKHGVIGFTRAMAAIVHSRGHDEVDYGHHFEWSGDEDHLLKRNSLPYLRTHVCLRHVLEFTLQSEHHLDFQEKNNLNNTLSYIQYIGIQVSKLKHKFEQNNSNLLSIRFP